MLCTPALAEMDVYINGEKADNIFSEQESSFKVMPGEEFAEMIGITYDAPFDEIEDYGGLEIAMKTVIAQNRNNLKGKSYQSGSFGEMCTMLYPQYPPGSFPYLLYIDCHTFYSGFYEMWIVRQDINNNLYYLNSNNIWTTIVSPLTQYATNGDAHIYPSKYLSWAIANSIFYIGVDNNPNGIIDGTIIVTIEDNL